MKKKKKNFQAVLSFDDQLKMFREYIGKLQAMVGEERTKFILANSLFLVVAGSDDIANTYFTIRVRKLQYSVPAYTDLMVNSASSFIQVTNKCWDGEFEDYCWSFHKN